MTAQTFGVRHRPFSEGRSAYLAAHARPFDTKLVSFQARSMLRRITHRQRLVLARAIGTPTAVAEHGHPHGVFRSLVIRGLLRRVGATRYTITPEGRAALHQAMRQHWRQR